MYIDCTQREERKKVFADLKETVGKAIEIKTTHITMPIDKFQKIEAVIERQEEIIEEQEERIAIMSEGGLHDAKVVLCKDCKHKEESVSPSWEAWCNRLHCGCDLDWFCADGEPKEGDQ